MGLDIKMLVAGIFFGIWPLVMVRSGLPAASAILAYVLIATSAVALYGLAVGVSFAGAAWGWLLAAGIAGGAGLVILADTFTHAPKERLAMLFVLMTVAQLATPVVWHLLSTQHLTFTQGIGLVAAFIAAVCLL